MKNILLLTGIYPPEIGGPATYVKHLAAELSANGHSVRVITYKSAKGAAEKSAWPVVEVSKKGGPLLRWWRYAQQIKKYANAADIVYAFSSVSCGMPLLFSGINKPKKILRLGGDFFWERYTAQGGKESLEEWTKLNGFWRLLMQKILQQFDHIVFSTLFQKKIYDRYYNGLPEGCIIENAVPTGVRVKREEPGAFRVLFMGRFVGFKNLTNLLLAVTQLPMVKLTLVGDGPEKKKLQELAHTLHIAERVDFCPPVHGDAKIQVFNEHDLLVLPSITEISPNTALEARANGLLVLLTQENGLSKELREGMVIRPLRTTLEIVQTMSEVYEHYTIYARDAMKEPYKRTWSTVARDHESLFNRV